LLTICVNLHIFIHFLVLLFVAVLVVTGAFVAVTAAAFDMCLRFLLYLWRISANTGNLSLNPSVALGKHFL